MPWLPAQESEWLHSFPTASLTWLRGWASPGLVLFSCQQLYTEAAIGFSSFRLTNRCRQKLTKIRHSLSITLSTKSCPLRSSAAHHTLSLAPCGTCPQAASYYVKLLRLVTNQNDNLWRWKHIQLKFGNILLKLENFYNVCVVSTAFK